jgi:CRP/FNR family transcriptional regulator, dissimilatory nitrate respiration regulator
MWCEMINTLFSEKNIKEKLSKPVFYQKNQIIFYETDLCTQIGIIIKGHIKLVHYTLSGEEIILSELNEGDIFGDMIIHANHPYYPGYLIALEQTQIVYINKKSLEELFSQSPLFTKQYIANISKKAALINYHHKILSMPSLQEKILYYVETQMKTHDSDKISFTNITKMADYFHVKRPSLSRKLNELKRQNIIDYNKNQIWLKTKVKL